MHGAISSFRDLEVWRLAMDLVDLTYSSTREIPGAEFDLRRQLRRAAVSIPANIAEGYRRKKRRAAYKNHVSIAMGSQGELETEVEIARRNLLMSAQTCQQLQSVCDRVGA